MDFYLEISILINFKIALGLFLRLVYFFVFSDARENGVAQRYAVQQFLQK
jgi:hypothetical protein